MENTIDYQKKEKENTNFFFFKKQVEETLADLQITK